MRQAPATTPAVAKNGVHKIFLFNMAATRQAPATTPAVAKHGVRT